MGNTGGITISIEKEGDKLIANDIIQRGLKLKWPLSNINDRARIPVLRQLIFHYPEYFPYSLVQRSKVDKTMSRIVMIGSGILYGASIILGRRVIRKNNGIPWRLMIPIYLFPIAICLPAFYLLVPLRQMAEIAKISKELKENIPNDKLFSMALVLYRERFTR